MTHSDQPTLSITPTYKPVIVDLSWLGLDGCSVSRDESGEIVFHGTDEESVTEAWYPVCVAVAKTVLRAFRRDDDPATIATRLWLRINGPKRRIELLGDTGFIAVPVRWMLKDDLRAARNSRFVALSRFEDEEESLPVDRYLTRPPEVELAETQRESENEHALRVRAIRAAVADLSDSQRMAFYARAKAIVGSEAADVLRSLGLDASEIGELEGTDALARATGVRPGTVASHASRACAKIRSTHAVLRNDRPSRGGVER